MRSFILVLTLLSIFSCSKDRCGDENASCISSAKAKSCQELTGKDYYSSLNLLVDDLIVCVDHRPECIVGSCDYQSQKIIEDPTDSSKNIILERRAAESQMYWVGEVEAAEVEIDSDGDGFPDEIDTLCPSTPEGVEIHKFGCSLEEWNKLMDLDGDGVLNNDDSCPGTKPGQTVDPETGCSEEDLADNTNPDDIDNDGVENDKDKCPATPEGAEEVDLANGCSKEQFNEADFDNDGVKNIDEGETKDGNSCIELSGKPFSQGCPLEIEHKREICKKYSSSYVYLKSKLESMNGESLICAIKPRFENLETAGIEKDYETISGNSTYDVSKKLMKDGSIFLIEGEMIRLANEKVKSDLLEIEIDLNLPEVASPPRFSFRYVGESQLMSNFQTRTSSSNFKIKIDKSDLKRSVFEYKFEGLGSYNCGGLAEGQVSALYPISLSSVDKLVFTCTKNIERGKLNFYIKDFFNNDISEVTISLKDPEDLVSYRPIILTKDRKSEDLEGMLDRRVEISKVEYKSVSNEKFYIIKTHFDKTGEINFIGNIKNMKYSLPESGEVSKNKYGIFFAKGKFPPKEDDGESEEEKGKDNKKLK